MVDQSNIDNINSVSTQEFLEGIAECLKGMQFNQYEFLSVNDRVRYLPDMFVKDAMKLEKFRCAFLTQSLDAETPEKVEFLILNFDLSGKPETYILGYDASDPCLNVVGDSILKGFEQKYKKRFATLRTFASLVFGNK